MQSKKRKKLTPARTLSLNVRAAALFRALKTLYPDADCALVHHGPFQLLVATILSAQCTDERVNKVTPAMFSKYPDAATMAKATQGDLEKMIHSTGFYRNKAKSLLETSRTLVRDHGGRVPDTMEQLLKLRGVARKTANVVLGNAFGKNEGVVVDTHVGRLSRRMGLTIHNDPVKVEQDLVSLFSRKDWTVLSHLLILHGRAVCKARHPACSLCLLSTVCPARGVDGAV